MISFCIHFPGKLLKQMRSETQTLSMFVYNLASVCCDGILLITKVNLRYASFFAFKNFYEFKADISISCPLSLIFITNLSSFDFILLAVACTFFTNYSNENTKFVYDSGNRAIELHLRGFVFFYNLITTSVTNF